jgi:hypothetical protein
MSTGRIDRCMPRQGRSIRSAVLGERRVCDGSSIHLLRGGITATCALRWLPEQMLVAAALSLVAWWVVTIYVDPDLLTQSGPLPVGNGGGHDGESLGVGR